MGRRKERPCRLCGEGTLADNEVCGGCVELWKRGKLYNESAKQDKEPVRWLNDFSMYSTPSERDGVTLPDVPHSNYGRIIPELLWKIARPMRVPSDVRRNANIVIARWNQSSDFRNPYDSVMLEASVASAVSDLYLWIVALYRHGLKEGRDKGERWLTAMAQGNATIDEINARAKATER